MRTVTFGLNISLDGYCDHTFANPTEELMDYFTAMMDDVDLLFYGRVMYQLMFPYWAEVAAEQTGSPAENRFAGRLVQIDRVVVSRTLETTAEKTRIVRDNPVGELLRLKQQTGGKISLGSVSMLPEMLTAGLIDEFYFVVHPVLIGNGRHLLDIGSLQKKLELKLVETRIFESGCVAIHLRK